MTVDGELRPNRLQVPQEALELLLTLQNQMRLEILAHLSHAEQSVAELAGLLELDMSAVSHALARLRAHRLVQHRVQKQRRIYSLTSRACAIIDVGESLFRVSSESVEITIRVQR